PAAQGSASRSSGRSPRRTEAAPTRRTGLRVAPTSGSHCPRTSRRRADADRLRGDVQALVRAPGLVHRLVGEAEELVAAADPVRAERDAEARRQRSNALVGIALERRPEPRRDRTGFRPGRLDEDERELVAADPEAR